MGEEGGEAEPGEEDDGEGEDTPGRQDHFRPGWQEEEKMELTMWCGRSSCTGNRRPKTPVQEDTFSSDDQFKYVQIFISEHLVSNLQKYLLFQEQPASSLLKSSSQHRWQRSASPWQRQLLQKETKTAIHHVQNIKISFGL